MYEGGFSMEQLDSGTLITLVTILVAGIGMIVGAILPALVEGRAVYKALDGMTRQPEVASDIRGTLIISLTLLETTAIYVLLVVLILIFANPLLERFFPTG
jgi:F-type H+-transporting ATPase subunit c